MIFVQFFGLVSGLAFIYLAYKFFESYFKNSPKSLTDASRAGRLGSVIYIVANGLASIILTTSVGIAGIPTGPGILMLASVAVLVASFFGGKHVNDPVSDKLNSFVKKGMDKYDQHRADNETHGFKFTGKKKSSDPENEGPSEKINHPPMDGGFYDNLRNDGDGVEHDK